MTSVTNLPISGPYPGLQFVAGESGGVYHEQREVDGTLYHTYNAIYDGTNWHIDDTLINFAFAFAQLPNGSVQFLANPAGTTTWSQWAGSGNNTVFNAADYGLSPTNSGTMNTTALQAAVNAVMLTGGILFIPAGQYPVSGTIEVAPVF